MFTSGCYKPLSVNEFLRPAMMNWFIHSECGDPGVCSTANIELVRFLGASRVIDYSIEDFTKNGETYDVVIDTVGTAPFSRCRTSLNKGGRLLMVLAGLSDMIKTLWVSTLGSNKVVVGPVVGCTADFHYLAAIARVGKFRPVIDRRFLLEQMIEAHRYVDTGRKRGNVAITLKHNNFT